MIFSTPPVLAQNNASAPIIFTVAGGTFGDGGPATSIGIGQVESIAIDKNGNLYFADSNNFLIRKVDSNGILTTVAGNGIPLGPQDVVVNFYAPRVSGFSDGTLNVNPTNTGDGGPATSASLAFPQQIAFDGTGNLYILDGNARIRKVDSHGVITTIAGNGISGLTGDGGPATNAEINTDGIQLDVNGNILFINTVCEPNNGNCDGVEIRKIDLQGNINTIAGNGTQGFTGDGGPAINAEINADPYHSMALDTSGNLCFVNLDQTDFGGTRIRKVDTNGIINTVAGNGTLGFSGDGGPATSAEISATNLAVDSVGNLYFVNLAGTAQQTDIRIRKVGTNGVITTIAGNGTQGFSGDGGAATSAAIYPGNIFTDSGGDILFTNFDANGGPRIRKVDLNGIINTIAGDGTDGFSGDGGQATSAEIDSDGYTQLVFDGNQRIYFLEDENYSDQNHRIRRIDTNGVVTTVAGNGTEGYSGDGGPATGKEIDSPAGITVDGQGNLYMADFNNDRIIKADTTNNITTVAGSGLEGYCASTALDCSADGAPATNAELFDPTSVAVDSSGNFYFIDDYSLYSVRKVDTNGTLGTVAGNGSFRVGGCSSLGDGGPATSACLSQPLGLAFDSSGNLYIGDTEDFRIRKVDTRGIITTVAGNGTAGFIGDGGPASDAEIGEPGGIAVDSNGNLYIGDGDNFRVRKVDTKGVITTVAGTGITGFSGDGGPATSAQITGVNGLAIDKSGNLYISDPFNNRVRRVDPNGVITTYVGSGSIGYSGDGGPATNASLTFPGALAVDGSGALYVGDVFNYRVRVVEAAFTLALNPTAVTIASPGESGTTSLAVTPGSRFTGNVSLTCSVAYAGTGSATKPPTCSLNSSMLAISGSGSLTSTLTVNTTAAQTSMLEINGSLSGRVTLALIGFLIIPCWKRRRALMLCLVLLCVITICVVPIGCGGGGGNGGGGGSTTTPGTTTGSYNVTITAASGSFTSSIVVPVTVQ